MPECFLTAHWQTASGHTRAYREHKSYLNRQLLIALHEATSRIGFCPKTGVFESTGNWLSPVTTKPIQS